LKVELASAQLVVLRTVAFKELEVKKVWNKECGNEDGGSLFGCMLRLLYVNVPGTILVLYVVASRH
jgi:hypothetical protein